MEEDDDVNIKCLQESLCKGQFTMHHVVNVGQGNDAHGWCDLICKGHR